VVYLEYYSDIYMEGLKVKDSGPNFEPRSFWIWSRSAKLSTETFVKER